MVTSDSPKDSGLALSRAQRAQVFSTQQAPYSTGESWEEDPAQRRQGVGGSPPLHPPNRGPLLLLPGPLLHTLWEESLLASVGTLPGI